MKTRFLLFVSFIGQFALAQQNKTQVSGDTIRGIQNMEGVVVKGLRAQDAPNNTTVNKQTTKHMPTDARQPLRRRDSVRDEREGAPLPALAAAAARR